MMLDNNVVPPVLEETTNVLNLDSDVAIRWLIACTKSRNRPFRDYRSFMARLFI